MWEESPSKLFRRKLGTGPSLPQYVNPVADDDKKSARSRYSRYGYIATLISSIMVMFFLVGGFDLFTGNSNFSFSYDEYDDDGTTATMDDIMKRHAYKPMATDAYHEKKQGSTLLTDGPPRKVLPPKLTDASSGERSIIDDTWKPDKTRIEFGNIVFFSFHGKVGNAVIMNELSKQLGYVDGGDLLLQQKIRGNETVTDKWDSYDESNFNNVNKKAIIEYINSVFAGYGAEPLKARKMISVHMTDAWANSVDIPWLLEVLQRVGGVTHVVATVRNPIRAKISGTPYHKSLKCSDMFCL
jgi:hypothetical protein